MCSHDKSSSLLLVSYRSLAKTSPLVLSTVTIQKRRRMTRLDTQSPYLAEAIEDHRNNHTNALSGRPVYAEMTAESRFRESAAVSFPPLSFDRILSRSEALTGVPTHFFLSGS